jgi:hypothetical protein
VLFSDGDNAFFISVWMHCPIPRIFFYDSIRRLDYNFYDYGYVNIVISLKGYKKDLYSTLKR